MFLNKGELKDSTDLYRFIIKHELPQFVTEKNDNLLFLVMSNSMDTVYLEVLGHSENYFSFMDLEVGHISVLVPEK